MNELQLRTGPYRTTFVGTEIVRPSTVDEWRRYLEILKRVDEAKQWAIGDWLVDGMQHFEEKHGEKKKHGGTGLYDEAEKILGIGYSMLTKYKSVSEQIEFCKRLQNLEWAHHYEVSSLKGIIEDKNGKSLLSDEPDLDKMQDFLSKAEKEGLSVRDLRPQRAVVHTTDNG